MLVTTDPDLYPDGRVREIPVVRMQDFDLVDSGEAPIDGTTVGADTVESIAFFADENGWKAQVRPRGAVGNYRVHYEPASVLQMPLPAPSDAGGIPMICCRSKRRLKRCHLRSGRVSKRKLRKCAGMRSRGR